MLASLFLAWTILVSEGHPMTIDLASETRFAELALACVHKEYPNKISHVLAGDEDVKAPRALTPAFYGCYDWHSSVHAHGCSPGSPVDIRTSPSPLGRGRRWRGA